MLSSQESVQDLVQREVQGAVGSPRQFGDVVRAVFRADSSQEGSLVSVRFGGDDWHVSTVLRYNGSIHGRETN